jgi:hypothetical protein
MPFNNSTTFPDVGAMSKLLTLVSPSISTISLNDRIKSGENYQSTRYENGVFASEYHRKFQAASLAMQVMTWGV